MRAVQGGRGACVGGTFSTKCEDLFLTGETDRVNYIGIGMLLLGGD